MDKGVRIHDSRYPILESEFQKEYFQDIIHFLKQEKISGKTLYPRGSDIFRAFELTHRENVSVVILGQDPYHGIGQAHGLCFSVPVGITPPPSLINIYKEIYTEYPDKNHVNNGDLSHRADQGVLLLNAFLTVEEGKPLSHSTIGREVFTNQIISLLSAQKEGLVFMLRGSFAKSKSALIDNQKHLILTANHPSPLSANRGGWFGNNHFTLANEYLVKQGKKVYYGYRFIYVHSMKTKLQQGFSASTQEKLNTLGEGLREIVEQYFTQINNDELITLVYKAACILGFKGVDYHKVTDENTKISQLHKFFFDFQNQLIFDNSFHSQFPGLPPRFAFNNPGIRIDVYQVFNAHQDEIEQKRQSFFDRLNELATHIPSGYIKPGSWRIDKESIIARMSILKHSYKLEVLNTWLQKRLQEVEDTGTGLETIADFIIMNKSLKKIQIGEPTIEELFSLLNE